MLQLPALGQDNEDPVRGEGWRRLDVNGFIYLSQLDDEQTMELAARLDVWRAAVAELLTTTDMPIPTYIFLFENQAALREFAPETSNAVFHPSLRANYLAMLNQPESIRQGLHELSHFLISNESGLNDPRWYEEAMVEYLSRLQLQNDSVTLPQPSAARLRTAMQIDSAMPLEVLFFDDSGLASPLLVQVANAKAAMVLHFLLHAHQQEDFRDYREGLQNYLALLDEQRRGRYAFDRGFPVSLNRLAAEYRRYLQLENRAPESLSIKINPQPLNTVPEAVPEAMALGMLAELGLNGGFFTTAEDHFRQAGLLDDSVGRYQSGLADARRMQDINQDFEVFYLTAIEKNPDEVQLHLDHGQYLEERLGDCTLQLNDSTRSRMLSAMQASYETALALNPDNPEANLSMAQVYLLPGFNWDDGLAYHQKARQLLPANSFVTEQAVNYAIADSRYDDAEQLINWLARPFHLWGEHYWITRLRQKLDAARQNRTFERCDA